MARIHGSLRPTTLSIYLLGFLLTLLPLLPTTLACLELRASISPGTPPTLRGDLVDNGINVCKISLSTTWGSRLSWNCLPGFRAYVTPDGGILNYEAGGRKMKIDNIRKIPWGAGGEQNGASYGFTWLQAKEYGCSLGPYVPGDGRDGSIWHKRVVRNEMRKVEGESSTVEGVNDVEVVEG